MFPMLRDALGEGTQKWIADRCGERPLAVSRWEVADSSQAQPHLEVREMPGACETRRIDAHRLRSAIPFVVPTLCAQLFCW